MIGKDNYYYEDGEGCDLDYPPSHYWEPKNQIPLIPSKEYPDPNKKDN